MHPKGRVFGWDEKWRENDRNDCLVDEGNWESISLFFFLFFFFFFFSKPLPITNVSSRNFFLGWVLRNSNCKNLIKKELHILTKK